ncbi:MAG: glycosyltransferase [Candidatus Solibacter sp.]
MRVDILAIGSRGDVQPYVALALGLRKAGFGARVVTLGGFEDLVGNRGMDHLAVGESPGAIAGTDAGRDWVKQRRSAGGFLQGFVRVAGPLIEQGLANYWNGPRDAEAIIVSPMGMLIGGHLAEKLGVPLIQANLAPPVLPSRYDWDGRRNWKSALGGKIFPLVHDAFHLVVWTKLRAMTNAARARVLGLAPLPASGPPGIKRLPMLAGFSSAVVTPPPDWRDGIHVTGYWFLSDNSGWSPPNEMMNFLGSGAPPVFAGFGSTPFPQPEVATAMVVRAIERSGNRGIVLAGGSGLATGRLSSNVYSIDSAPHDWLFPRVCAAIHHGGAGVTGAALRAGLPSVVVPVFADQPFWGRRVHSLGVGPRPIPATKLTEDNLAEAIRATSSAEMRARATRLGQRIRAEDGVANAVASFSRLVGRGVAAGRRQHAG